MSFSQQPAVEKDIEKWAAGKFLGPSYFEATLEIENFFEFHSLRLRICKKIEITGTICSNSEKT